MKKIKAILVDDESLARDAIKEFLKKHPYVELVAEGENGIEAVNLVNELRPDILFLDIQMPELNGFAALKEIEARVLPLVIFTTAYDQYALKAFDASAIDYLLKPFDQGRFDVAIERALRYLHSIDKNNREAERARVISYYEGLIPQNKTKPFIERLLVKENRKLIPVLIKDVLIFEADADYVILYREEGKKKHLVNTSLTHLETVLNPAQFVRIHRSTIIKIDSITEMKHHFNGEFKILMKNGMEVKLSRSYKDALKKISGDIEV
jgi:two-component system LytT family response regulator